LFPPLLLPPSLLPHIPITLPYLRSLVTLDNSKFR
jgi:hypothetical protein